MKAFKLLLFIILSTSLYSQSQVDSWGVGAGFNYPRYLSISRGSVSENANFGGFISLQNKISDHFGFRFLTDYAHLESIYGPNQQKQKLDLYSGNLDVLYEVFPCESLSPYFLGGLGVTNFTSTNSLTKELNKNLWGYQLNMGLGLELKLSSLISLKSEAVYRTSSNNKIDGNMNTNETKGFFRSNGDTYLTMDLGVIWYFASGKNTGFCEKCPDGIREIIKIDTLITEVPVEVIKKQIDTVYVEKPLLFGIHFDFNKYDISVESLPILEHALEVLHNYPDIKLNISGYTDNIGSETYNLKLSEKRAKTVYNFFIKNGISPDRLSKTAYGEMFSIKSNNSAKNRAFNRRVELKSQDALYYSRKE